MCKFYSAIVTKNGNLYHKTSIISHEYIIDLYNLNDMSLHDNLCRVEFYPDNYEDMDKPDKYNLHIDENYIPEWFEEYRDGVISRLKDIITNMIVKVDTKILCAGG